MPVGLGWVISMRFVDAVALRAVALEVLGAMFVALRDEGCAFPSDDA
jgi:hypothetical protein